MLLKYTSIVGKVKNDQTLEQDNQYQMMSARARGDRRRFTETQMNKLRNAIFTKGVAMDLIVSQLSMKDTMNVQLVNRAFNTLVVGNSKSFRNRTVVISRKNSRDIALSPYINRMWLSAKLYGLLEPLDYFRLRYVWRELETLSVVSSVGSNSITKKLSHHILREVLIRTTKLRSLEISADILCGSKQEDLTNLEHVWNNLKHFELWLRPEDPIRSVTVYKHVPIRWTNSVFYFDGPKDRENLKVCMQTLSNFQWTFLESLAVHTVQPTTQEFLTNNVLRNVKKLELNRYGDTSLDQAFWEYFNGFELPNLVDFKCYLFDCRQNVMINFTRFWRNQRNLTSLEIQSQNLTQGLFEVNEEDRRPINLKYLKIKYLDQGELSADFGLLLQMNQLETFVFHGFDGLSLQCRTGPRQPSMEEIIASIPASVTCVDFKVDTSTNREYQGFDEDEEEDEDEYDVEDDDQDEVELEDEDEDDDDDEAWGLLSAEFLRLCKLQLPNMKTYCASIQKYEPDQFNAAAA